MYRKQLLGTLTVIVGLMLIMMGFAGIYQVNKDNLYSQNNPINYVNQQIMDDASHFNMNQISTSTKVINASGTTILIKSGVFHENRSVTGLSIVISVNGTLYSATFSIIKNTSISSCELTVIPIYGGDLNKIESMNITKSQFADARSAQSSSSVALNGFSYGWLGFAITLDQQQTQELIALLTSGAGISAFIIAVAGVTVAAGLIAAIVALVLTLTISYITFMDAYGNFQGIYFAETWADVGWIGAPENSVPWGF